MIIIGGRSHEKTNADDIPNHVPCFYHAALRAPCHGEGVTSATELVNATDNGNVRVGVTWDVASKEDKALLYSVKRGRPNEM